MINKNINNTTNSGLYDYPGINLERIDSYINDNNTSPLKNKISVKEGSFEYNDNTIKN